MCTTKRLRGLRYYSCVCVWCGSRVCTKCVCVLVQQKFSVLFRVYKRERVDEEKQQKTERRIFRSAIPIAVVCVCVYEYVYIYCSLLHYQTHSHSHTYILLWAEDTSSKYIAFIQTKLFHAKRCRRRRVVFVFTCITFLLLRRLQ